MAKALQSKRIELIIVGEDKRPVKKAGDKRGGLVYLDDGTVAMQCGDAVYVIDFVRGGDGNGKVD